MDERGGRVGEGGGQKEKVNGEITEAEPEDGGVETKETRADEKKGGYLILLNSHR